MIDIEIKNDGKEKCQSYECYISGQLEGDGSEVYIYGFGANEKEAKEDCFKKVDQIIARLNRLKEDFKNGNMGGEKTSL